MTRVRIETLFLSVMLATAGTKLGAADLTWTGAANTNWDTTSTNWTGESPIYTAGDSVTFSDYGVTVLNTNVFIQLAGVVPSGITISNSTSKSFTFAGGGIAGSAPLRKAGPGTATFNSTDISGTLAFGGGTEVDGGTVQWKYTASALTTAFGTASITLNGGTFSFRAGNTQPTK